MEKNNTKEDLKNLFKKINCYGEKYNYCFECATIQNMYFGAIGVLISIKKNKNVMGYLLNQTEKGITLIPIVKETMNKSKIEEQNYIFIPQNKIETVKITNEEINFKRIVISLKDGTKYKMKTIKKTKKNPEHNQNVNRFIDMYSKK